MSLKVEYTDVVGLNKRNFQIVVNSHYKWAKVWHMSDLEIGLSMLLKLKSDGAAGLSICDFLLVLKVTFDLILLL